MAHSKYERFYTFDLPVPYKELNIYPVKMIDYVLFNYFATCLTLDKNSIPDAKIIMMTYLEYIYSETEKDPEKTPYVYFLDRILANVLRDNKDEFVDIGKSLTRYKRDSKGKPLIFIGDKQYNSDDFDNIKQIICEQNLLELPDEKVQKELRDKMEEARRLRQKTEKNKIASLEEQIISLSIYTGWKIEEIYQMPIRKFIKAIHRADHKLHYEIYLAASMSGMVEFKDKSFIKHWLVDLEKENPYEDVTIDSQAMKDKINLTDKKK